MNYVTTNIRIPEEDYLRFKTEAAKKRKSFSAVVRERIGVKEHKRSEKEVAKIIAGTRKHAKENTKHLKGFDSLKILREIRNEPAW